ncbi:MAG: hypothetical protein ABI324_04430 [Ktedonobacteraceae bacterium]
MNILVEHVQTVLSTTPERWQRLVSFRNDYETEHWHNPIEEHTIL